MKRVYPARAIQKSLLKKGFRARQGDHTFLHLYVGDLRSSVFTKISHSHPEYGSGLLAQVRRQLGNLSPAEFADLVECPMDEARYVELLRQKGFVQS